MTTTNVPITEARDHLAEIVESVRSTHERVTLTKHGDPVAVLIAVDDLYSIEESLDILGEPGALEEILEAEADIEAGRTVSIEELRESVLKRMSAEEAAGLRGA